MRQSHYHYLVMLICLFMTVILVSLFLFDRTVTIVGHETTGTSLTIPLAFMIADIIAEVYGYAIARQLIWINLICMPLFALLATVINWLPGPISWHFNANYTVVIHAMFIVSIFISIGIAAGSFVNSYMLLKFGAWIHGRYFWLRSIMATVSGGIVAIIIGYLKLLGNVPSHIWLDFVITTLVYGIICTVIFSIPIAAIARLLKRIEKPTTYDKVTNFNPFKFKVNGEG